MLEEDKQDCGSLREVRTYYYARGAEYALLSLLNIVQADCAITERGLSCHKVNALKISCIAVRRSQSCEGVRCQFLGEI